MRHGGRGLHSASVPQPGFTPHGSCKLCTVNVNGRNCLGLHLSRRRRPESVNNTPGTERNAARPSPRCCSSRVTTSARPAKKAATANYRRWAISEHAGRPLSPFLIRAGKWMPRIRIVCWTATAAYFATVRARQPGCGRQERVCAIAGAASIRI